MKLYRTSQYRSVIQHIYMLFINKLLKKWSVWFVRFEMKISQHILKI